MCLGSKLRGIEPLGEESSRFGVELVWNKSRFGVQMAWDRNFGGRVKWVSGMKWRGVETRGRVEWVWVEMLWGSILN